MSDPAQGTDIEDVLSSIRKLVSTEAVSAPLVLTPDRRVDARSEAPGPLVLTQPALTADGGRRDASLEARIAELETVVASRIMRSDADALPGSADPSQTAPATIDEAALRDMVSEIVRDELRGVMGERITRNMRRLVRREIMRAIAAGDLD